jgi:glycosyltransferase involved in cell wall biosynthesis
MEKKVLIITYYWPPSGGSGVQRWLKFVKYLPEFGWQPYVLTPENPSFAIRDESLLQDVNPAADVFRLPIWEPYDLFLRLSSALGGKKRTAKPTDLVGGRRSLFQTIGTWIRGNLFLPDPRRFWIKPASKFLEGLIRDNGIGVMVTTGPPHSMHLIGARLKKKIPSIRWIADFRDPWSQWGLLDSLLTGTWARAVHRRLEANVLRSADVLVTVTPFYARQFATLADRHVHMIPNGYDENDVSKIRYTKSNRFIIRHVGIVNERCNPRPFMDVLRSLIQAGGSFAEDLGIEFIGEVHPAFRAEVNADGIMSRYTAFTGNVPRDELMERYGDSALLLLVLHGYRDAEGYLPGKLFEYIATGFPVLGVGPPDGDAAALLKESGAGTMIAADDTMAIEQYVLDVYAAWKKGDVWRNDTPPATYSRRELTRRMAELLQ